MFEILASIQDLRRLFILMKNQLKLGIKSLNISPWTIIKSKNQLFKYYGGMFITSYIHVQDELNEEDNRYLQRHTVIVQVGKQYKENKT